MIHNTITDLNHRLERLYDAIGAGKLNLDDVAVRMHDLRLRQEQP